MGTAVLSLTLLAACGKQGNADGIDDGGGARDLAVPDDGTTAEDGGSAGASDDSAVVDRPVDAAEGAETGGLDAATDVPRSDAGRPTPKLTWTLMTPGWDADYISGAANGEIWIASKPSSVLQIRADGTSAQSSLMLLGNAYVTSLWVAGPNNVYASAYANLVLHWDGSGTWKRDIMTSGTVFGSVWGSSPTDVYAVGGGGPYHSIGDDRWTTVPIVETLTAGMGPLGGTGPHDIWLAGIYGEVFRSTGDGLWHREPSPQTPGVNQIWVASPAEAYMVSNLTIMHRLPTTSRWVAERTPLGSTDYMYCIWGSGPTDVYAGTNQAHLFHSVGDGVWEDEGFDPGAGVKPAIKGIWGRSASDVYLATSNGIFHGAP